MNRFRSYDYTLLKDVKVNTTVHVFAVVKFVKPAEKTRGSDYYMLLSLVDESLVDSHDDVESDKCKLKCLIFAPLDRLPQDLGPGDIVRLHRLKVNRYNGELQGQSGPGFSWLVFRGDVDSPLSPTSSNSSKYTLTDENWDRVKALRLWASTNSEAQTVLAEKPLELTLSDIKLEKFFNLTCQVVATCVIPNRSACLLRVWDGTKPALQLYEEDTRRNALDLKTDQYLYDQALGFLADVFIFSSYFDAASRVQPGDFIKIINLHATRYKEQGGQISTTPLPLAQLCLHDGGKQFGRDFKHLDEVCEEVVRLKLALSKVGGGQEVDEDDSLIGNCGYSTPVKRARLSLHEDDSTGDMSPTHPKPSVDRCMLRTATVTKGHHHIPITSLKDIQSQEAPNKFRVHVQIVDYQPRVAEVYKFLKLVCNICNFVTCIPKGKRDEAKMELSRYMEENGIVQYQCPECLRHDRVSLLDFTYMLQLVLYDGTAFVTTQLWKQEAVHFFHDTPAVNLVKKPELYSSLSEELQQLSPVVADSKFEDNPWAELCIMSYNRSHGTCYQIFDTTLCAPE